LSRFATGPHISFGGGLDPEAPPSNIPGPLKREHLEAARARSPAGRGRKHLLHRLDTELRPAKIHKPLKREHLEAARNRMRHHFLDLHTETPA
jgi:hypothetical protein